MCKEQCVAQIVAKDDCWEMRTLRIEEDKKREATGIRSGKRINMSASIHSGRT